MSTQIIVVSDLHTNSFYGLFPPGFKIEGSEYRLNPYQRFLWRGWQDFNKQVPKGAILVVNGDLVQGIHSNKETSIITTSGTDMRAACVELLTPLVEKCKKVFVIKGTNYHGGVGEQDTEDIAKEIGAVKDEGTGRYSQYNLWLEHDGLLYHFAHTISVAPVYPLNPMQRELMNAKLMAVDNGYPCPDVIVRSHRHQYREYCNRGRWVIVTAGWQLQTDYILTKAPMSLPDVGGLILWSKKGCLEHQSVLYPLPKPKILSSKTF